MLRFIFPVDNPIPYSLDQYERCGYCPSMFVTDDGSTIYYINNAPCYEAGYKISVAKIKIS
ncbi:MAG: hypothetical protein IJZ57_06290 [Clostridia bacterium]|nr:hypothetical protein [Clostridia bacterium]